MTNLEFIVAAEKIRAAGYGYIWGAKGQIATETLLQSCISAARASGRYTFTQDKIDYIRKNYIAKRKRVVDCSGLLTLSAGLPVAGSAAIWDFCKSKGKLPSVHPELVIPNVPGLVVYRIGHIGIYLGNGMVLESGGTKIGVVITKLSEPATGSNWTGYGYWSKLDYVQEPVVVPPVEVPQVIVPEVVVPPVSENAVVIYQTQIENIGWQDPAFDGSESGTVGKSLRIEAIRIRLNNGIGDIQYSTHIQDLGWMDYVKSNEISGTVGQSKRMEAIRIGLLGEISLTHDILYQVHVQDIGWMDWVRNKALAGTVGQSKRIEAIRIKIVAK